MFVSAPKSHITITRYFVLRTCILMYDDIRFAIFPNNIFRETGKDNIDFLYCVLLCILVERNKRSCRNVTVYIHRKTGRGMSEVIAMKPPKYHNWKIFKKVGINIISVEATISTDQFVLLLNDSRLVVLRTIVNTVMQKLSESMSVCMRDFWKIFIYLYLHILIRYNKM